ncbi:BREX system P-loop protein BrxC [Aeoliella sp.]|uniref:BREX system P-loop protein BrxC n=1 Tax=Aeoliella sp. TaxID=2795800 RepID=UPI003CCB9DC8
MTAQYIKDIFARDIHRDIREVIKVDQADEEVIRSEIGEYIVTKTILSNFIEILEAYSASPNKPSDRMAVWVSGFFGSGKSSFAKLLGLALANRQLGSDTTSELLADHIGDSKVAVLIKTVVEKIPTEAVIFDVATERGVMHGNQMLTEIMYRQLLEHLGYASDLDLAELEITLEGEGRLEEFKDTYKGLYPKKNWDKSKNLIAFAMNEASRVMHELEPETYSSPDSWIRGAKERADISPNHLADRCKELTARRGENRNIVFVIDEVGQFVARTVNKMLDLQGIVQALGRVGQGKFWVIATSQEKLNELVGGLDDSRVELARLMDRFPLQVHLEPSDISEVTSKRVLAKKAGAEKQLGEVYEANRGSLTANTNLSADIRLPQVARENFIDLYPMLPYQVDFVIHVVSGLRTQGGASRHVGGANRTVIKLAQQLLAHPKVGLGEHEVGQLVTVEHIYDLVRDNIDSSIREKIDRLATEVDHLFAQKVAKSICLLQFVKSIHRNAENIAATLYPSVGGDSARASVDQALQALLDAHKIRLGDDGYRIPTPTEDDWETQRAALKPKRADSNQILRETIEKLWQPQPVHTLLGTRAFKGSLFLDGRERVKGDIDFQVRLAEDDKDDYERLKAELREQSQVERGTIFWIIPVGERIEKEVTEVFRSKEMISKKERGAQTAAETRLLSEEGRRRDTHRGEVRRLLEQSALTSVIYFQGNDRSPDESDQSIIRAAESTMAKALPEVFERFEEGAARVGKKDIQALLDSEDLRGLPAVFTSLKLLRNENGSIVMETDTGPLAEMLSWINNKSDYGINPAGKAIESEFNSAPFGWDIDVVKLFALSLLRSGQITVTSQGVTIESVVDLGAIDAFTNNTKFRSCTFRPKKVLDFAEIVKAGSAYEDTFGEKIASLTQDEVAKAIREKAIACQRNLRGVLATLERNQLPGCELFATAISQMEQIVSANEEETILSFAGGHAKLKDAISRAADISKSIGEPQLQSLSRAQTALRRYWPFLVDEESTTDEHRSCAEELADLLERETFYRELPKMDQAASKLCKLYEAVFEATAKSRAECYTSAVDQLKGTPGWEQLDEERQVKIGEPLTSRAVEEVPSSTPIPQLRADIDACDKRLADAVAEVHRLLEGDRVVRVKIGSHFASGIDTEEQLDGALGSLREECLHLIGKNKRILIQ